jgi:hypothetical protein
VTIFAPLNTLMDSEQKRISYFVSFCVEQYKNAKHLTGSQAFEELNQYGVLDYLVENYEILHTQSYQWILEDIDEFINIRKQRTITQDNLYLSFVAFQSELVGRNAFRRYGRWHCGSHSSNLSVGNVQEIGN